MTTIVTQPSWFLCVSGGVFAVRRARQSLNNPTGHDAEALRAICEAIWWIVCADEMLKAESVGYVKYREYLGITNQMVGLRWVRNRITHQISHSSIIEPPFHWAPDSDIPSNPDRDRDRPVYRKNLAGREIIPLLEGLLENLRELPRKYPL